MSDEARRLTAWPTVDEVRETFKKSADRIAFGRMIAEVERKAAEKAFNYAVSIVGIDLDLVNHFKDSNPYRKAVQS